MTPEMAADITTYGIVLAALVFGIGFMLGKRAGQRADRLRDWHYPHIDLDGNRDTSRALCNPSQATG